MRKIMALLLATTMVLSTLSACLIPVYAETADAGTFTEDFEGYGTGNWIEHIDENGFVKNTISGMQENTWTIYGSNFNTNDAAGLVEVVEYPAGSGNKALKMGTGLMESGSWYRIRRNSNGNTGITRDSMTGKKLVIKADFWVPSDYSSAGDVSFFYYDALAKRNSLYFGGTGQYGGTGTSRTWYIHGAGKWRNNVYGRVQAAMLADKTELKYIFDLTEKATENHPADTVRAFYGDAIYTFKLGNEGTGGNNSLVVNSKYPQPNTDGTVGARVIDSWGAYQNFASESATITINDFFGASHTVAPGKQNVALYMDNLAAYYVDPFKQEGDITFGLVDENGGWYKGGIEIPFNNAIRESVVEQAAENNTKPAKKTYQLSDLVKVINKQTGEELADVEVATANEGKTLVVTPPSGLEAGSEYKIVADALFMDTEGQGLNQYSKETELTTFTTGVDANTHIIYEENFENYTKDAEWLPAITGKESVASGYAQTPGKNVDKNAWNYSMSSSYNKNGSGASVKPVVLKGHEDKGQVLAITAPAVQNQWINIRRNANGRDGIARGEMQEGKKLVYEVKFYIPKGNRFNEAAFLSNSKSADVGSSNNFSCTNSTMAASSTNSSMYMAASGEYYFPQARNNVSGLGDEWHTMRVVVDTSKTPSATHSDAMRVTLDDSTVITSYYTKAATYNKDGVSYDAVELTETPLDTNYNMGKWYVVNPNYPVIVNTEKTPNKQIDFVSSTFKSATEFKQMDVFYGNQFSALAAVAGEGNTFYIDDLKAYWVDALDFTLVNGTDYEEGTIDLVFNQEIQENFKENVSDAPGKNKEEKDWAIEDLFKVVDKYDNVIEDGLANILLSDDKMTVSITPSEKLEEGVSYRIVIDPLLMDKYGQGLNKNGHNKETYVDIKIKGNDAPFELESLSKDFIEFFKQGIETKVEAKFNCTIYDDDITKGIVVKNSATGEIVKRNEGWTAEFAEGDNKTIIFDFTNLPTANYTVTVNDEFVAKNGKQLTSEFKITIEEISKGKVILFEENFDSGYTLDENWVNSSNPGSSDLKASGNTYFTTADGKWDIEIKGTKNDDDFVGVVKAPALDSTGNFSGNVLKISNTRATAWSNNWTAVRRNFDGKEGISLTSSNYKDKTLVYEADVYSPQVKWETSFMMPSRHRAYIREYEVAGQFSGMLMSGGTFRMAHGTYASPSYGARFMWYVAPSTATKVTGSPKKLIIAIDQTSEVDTARVYFDGKQLTGTYPEDALEGHPTSGLKLKDFQGSGYKGQAVNLADKLYGVWSLASNNTLYFDNFKAYLVDTFSIEAVEGATDEFNTAKSRVVYTFSKPVDPTTLEENVALLDETGAEIGNGIESLSLSDSNTKLTVKLTETLIGLTKYTVYIKGGLKDVDGLELSTKYSYYDKYDMDEHYTKNTDGTYDVMIGTKLHNLTYKPRTESTPATLAITEGNKYEAPIDCYLPDDYVMKTKVDIKTTKATSLFATAQPAIVNGNSATAEIFFTNPEQEDISVWAMLVAYDEKNAMLGCTTISKTVGAMSQTQAQNYTVNANGGEIKSVILCVWNNYVDMNPYHRAETLFGE